MYSIFDLNYCNTPGTSTPSLSQYIKELKSESKSESKSKIPVVILDYKSATTDLIQKSIEEVQAEGMKLILLINSGLKNEQFGVDNNPYGTVRIVTKDQDLANKLLALIKTVTDTQPKIAQAILHGYRESGFTVKTADLVTKPSVPNPNNNAETIPKNQPIVPKKLHAGE